MDYFEGVKAATFQLWAKSTTGDPFIVPSSWLSPTVESLPSGWSASTALASDAGAYVSAAVQANAVVLTDATGTAHTYTRTSAGGYTPPAGEYGVLALSSTTKQVQLADEDGTVYVFGTNGRLDSATPATATATATPAIPVTHYRPSTGQLDTITDPVTTRAVKSEP